MTQPPIPAGTSPTARTSSGGSQVIRASDGIEAMELHGIAVDREGLAAICLSHHISRLLVYGSVLRDDFRADSDVDMLVEFEPGHTPGFEFIGIQEELSSLIGRTVDLGTPAGLSKYIRERVMGEARKAYVL